MDIEKKLELIRKMESGVNRSVITNSYNVGKSTLYDLYKQRDELKRYADQGVRGNMAKRKITHKAKHVEVGVGGQQVVFGSAC